MALKLRKDIKKSSYYVWFLGAKESKGLRGADYILPVIKHLEDREKDVEPFKVTLQVSHKGLKIIQNIVGPPPPGGGKNAKPKNETIKHFIPHNTITCVYQHDDVIACILLLFNPVTKCPLHVHAYRCDSLETATHLKCQLQILIDRPENQKKISEIENRLKPSKSLENSHTTNNNSTSNSNNKIQQKKFENNSVGSDAGASSSTRESESSEERFALENSRISNLYDSVAAELREKLGKKNSPILLPPRDYDTVHRQKGNLTGIELRRCLNTNIVGQNVINGKNKRLESSGGSSGIGSDHPPSPESPETPENQRYHTLETHSTTDDEDWNGDTADSTLYLINENHQVTLPRPLQRNQINRNDSDEYRRMGKSPIQHDHEDDEEEEIHQRFSKYGHDELKFSKSLDHDDYRKSTSNNSPTNKYLADKSKLLLKKQKSAIFERDLLKDERKENFRKSLEKQLMSRGGKAIKYLENSYNEHQQRERERERYFYNEKQDRNHLNETYFEDDGFDENIRSRNNSADFEKNHTSRSYSYNNNNNNNNNTNDNENEEIFFKEQRIYPIPKTRQSNRIEKEIRGKSGNEDRTKFSSKEIKNYELKSLERNYNSEPPCSNEPNRRQPKYRQRSPSPAEEAKAPKDRFLNAKEKFLLMEKERLMEQERCRGGGGGGGTPIGEVPISPMIQKDKNHFIKRHQSMAYGTKNHLRNSYDDRYHNRDFPTSEEIHPKPAPRYFTEEPQQRAGYIREHKEPAFDRYRNLDKQDPKRRSMFSLIEEEHKKNSNEIARELKRRSYLDNNTSGGSGGSGFHSLNGIGGSDERGGDYMHITNHHHHREVDYRSSGGGRGKDNSIWNYQEFDEDRHNSLNHNFSKSSHNLDRIPSNEQHQKFVKNPQKILMMKSIPGYRHSYVEPKIRVEPKKKNLIIADNNMLHRNNSTVGYMHPRVGIASIHPY